MRFLDAAGTLRQLTFEAATLFLGIVELTEGVADLEAADEDLKTLDPVGVFLGLTLVLRQRRDGQRNRK